MRRPLLIATILLLPIIWLPGASAFWAWGTRTHFAPLGWWYATHWWRANWWVNLWLILSPLAATVILLAIVFPFARRSFLQHHPPGGTLPEQQTVPPTRSPNLLHGDAHWGNERDILALWGASASRGGIAVGELYDPRSLRQQFRPLDRSTWGPGGTARLLVDPLSGSGHTIRVAGSRGFKTQSAVTTGVIWPSSLFVLDPACELTPMLAPARAARGNDVYVLSRDTSKQCAFDVLDWIDINSPAAEEHIDTALDQACDFDDNPKEGSTQFFQGRAKALLTAVLSDILWDTSLLPAFKTLKAMKQRISVPETHLKKYLAKIHTSSGSLRARRIAAEFTDSSASDTLGGIMLSAHEATHWLSLEHYADLVSGSSFKSSDIGNGHTSIFLSLPVESLHGKPGAARCIVAALFHSLYRAGGAVPGKTLFLIDEAYQLGPRFAPLAIARDYAPKFGISLHLIYQSVAQIRGQWGDEGLHTWWNNADWVAFNGVADHQTAKQLSEQLGTYGAITTSQSRSIGWQGLFGMGFGSRLNRNRNTTTSETAVPLATAQEIMTYRRDAQLVLPRGGRGIVCGLPIAFRRPEIAATLGVNPFPP